MHHLKTYLLTAVAFVAGGLLGSAIHPVPVSAQNVSATIRVQELPTDRSTTMHGQLRGFSCATDGSGNIHCFGASD
jgi:hypothetical protein